MDQLQQVGAIWTIALCGLALLVLIWCWFRDHCKKFLGFTVVAHADINHEKEKQNAIAKFDKQCPPILWGHSMSEPQMAGHKYENRIRADEKLEKLVIAELQETEDIKALEEGSNSECNSKMCSVCLSEFEENDSVRQLPCGHLFHTSCVDEWLFQKRERGQTQCCPQRCPMCRQYVVVDSPRTVPEELARVLGVWARSDGRIIATINKSHILWSRNPLETQFILRHNLIMIMLNGKSFIGTVGEGQITWSDGDKWQLSVTSAENTHSARDLSPRRLPIDVPGIRLPLDVPGVLENTHMTTHVNDVPTRVVVSPV